MVRALTSAASEHLAHTATYRMLRRLRLRIVQTLQSIPLGRVQARSAGELTKTLHDDVEQLEKAFAHGVPDGSAAAAVPLATTAALRRRLAAGTDRVWATAMAVCAAILVLQWIRSTLCLRFVGQGPVERLWRMATWWDAGAGTTAAPAGRGQRH